VAINTFLYIDGPFMIMDDCGLRIIRQGFGYRVVDAVFDDELKSFSEVLDYIGNINLANDRDFSYEFLSPLERRRCEDLRPVLINRAYESMLDFLEHPDFTDEDWGISPGDVIDSPGQLFLFQQSL
jgi:hypothetical protein